MSKYINSLMQMTAASVVMMSAIVAEQTNMSNPPAQPCQATDMCYSYPMLDNGYMVHMDVGYLLEQFVLTGTDFGFSNDGAFGVLPQSVKVLAPKFNVASGVTAELGYYFEHDHWFLNSRFDWVAKKGHKSWSAGSTTGVVVPSGIWTTNMIDSGTDATSFTDVSESLKVSYYDLQIDLNRGTLATKHLAFEPHAGLKAAWIYYSGAQAYTGGSAGLLELNRSETTSFWGLGPDFGVNSEWKFCNGFSAYCDSTVALLCGGANVKDTVSVSDVTRTYGRSNRIVFSPTARAMMGFQYNSGLFDSTQNVRVRLGIDSAYYWNQFQHLNVVNGADAATFTSADNGGFGMIGMMIELGWDF